MIIGNHLRALREEKNLSRADMEKRTGLTRCYVSRVENNGANFRSDSWRRDLAIAASDRDTLPHFRIE